MAYEYKESHKHKLAKELLFKWLSEANGINGNSNSKWCNFAQFYWKPHFVLQEMIVQEKDWEFYFEGGSERCSYDFKELRHNEIIKNYGKILFVPDITVFHCGSPAYIFEIKHTHGLTKEKVKTMKDFFPGVQVVEIMADDILNLDCTKIPEKIKCVEW